MFFQLREVRLVQDQVLQRLFQMRFTCKITSKTGVEGKKTYQRGSDDSMMGHDAADVLVLADYSLPGVPDVGRLPFGLVVADKNNLEKKIGNYTRISSSKCHFFIFKKLFYSVLCKVISLQFSAQVVQW